MTSKATIFEKLKEKAKSSPLRKLSRQFTGNSEVADDTPDEDQTTPVCTNGSHVVRCLEDLFIDSSAMTFFMRFMERQGNLNYLKFWIHAEGFKMAGERANLAEEASQIIALYLSDSSGKAIDIPSDVRSSLSDENVTKSYFAQVQKYVWNRLKQSHFKAFLKSPYFLMHQLEVFKTGTLELEDILQDHRLLTPFVEYLDSKERRCLIEFIMAVQVYDEESECPSGSINDSSPSSSSLQENAMVIYERFISMQAREPLNFDNDIRIQVESNICTEFGRPKFRPFEVAKLAAHAVLETQYIPGFMQSELFKTYVTSLAQAVEHFSAMERDREDVLRKRSSLPATSPHVSLSPTASLKVSGQQVQKRVVQVRSASTSSTVPDDECSSQCSSSSHGGSALGRIDMLGRYESLFDTSPYSSESMHGSTSGFRNVLSKYLKQSMAQEDEKSFEMARMIVEDVRNMVLENANNITGDNHRKAR